MAKTEVTVERVTVERGFVLGIREYKPGERVSIHNYYVPRLVESGYVRRDMQAQKDPGKPSDVEQEQPSVEPDPPPKRGRGRPRKNPIKE